MNRIMNINGFKKTSFNIRLKTGVFIEYLPKLFKGDLTFKRFVSFLRRLLFFIGKMQHNKFVSINGQTRVDLYVPGYPSKAFFTACDKFMEFDHQLPCATVLLSVTSACRYNCKHCYQRLDKGKDVDLDVLVAATRKLQDMGVAFFNIEGGEPFLVYDRLKTLCASIDDRSEIWVNSTGFGMTMERVLELKKLNVTAVMFSLHTPDLNTFDKFMGYEGAWGNMEKGIKICHEAGVAVAFNSCLMKEAFYDGTFEKVMEVAKDFGASLIQIINPKPSGRWLGNEDIRFIEEDLEQVRKKVNMYNMEKAYWDFPTISAQVLEEDKEAFGCTSGGIDRFYINAKGDVQPCEFLNISFGNIVEEDFEEIYRKMRECFKWGGDCKLCEKYSGKIAKVLKNKGLDTLPLTLKDSEEIYKDWDRGDKTDMYERIERLK